VNDYVERRIEVGLENAYIRDDFVLCRFFGGEACILRMVLGSMKDEWGID
jgi:hypothetical protein